jgi:quercetin dioxygenase-like cupin family protein
MANVKRAVLGPTEGDTVRLRDLGVRFMIEEGDGEGRFSLVEHPMPPRSLGAPLHTHANEDEFSYVLEGRVGLQLGDKILEAGPGDLVFKPRNVPHAFWNAGDQPARLLEIISPGGFENYFREMAEVLAVPSPDFVRAGEICARYGIDMHFESAAELIARHGLHGAMAA